MEAQMNRLTGAKNHAHIDLFVVGEGFAYPARGDDHANGDGGESQDIKLA